MPPKKADKKDDPAKFVDKENLQRAETEILSLQHLVEQRTQEVRLGVLGALHLHFIVQLWNCHPLHA